MSGADGIRKTIEENKSILSEDETQVMALVAKHGQAHLFKDWSPAGKDDEGKHKLLRTLLNVDRDYPGGLVSYIEKARKLLKDSLVGVNPFEGWVPSVPAGERLKFGDERFVALEAIGLEELRRTGFILVAGGLGERLGYSGIKVSLPYETTTGTCYLKYYIQNILTIQQKARERTKRKITLPFAIMTSGDTHARTLDLLKRNKNYGMEPGQITLMQQKKVPALMNNDAQFCLKAPFTLNTKPHGHGDVHVLVHQQGVAKRWMKENGTKWILFFQDTNGQVFRGLPAALGVSKENQFAMNMLTVPRVPGQAMGAITKLQKEERAMTCNVEYNQLGPLLLNTGERKGDVADETGFSPYPGNCNIFILESSTYCEVLERSNGLMPEFVNPKYKGESKMEFKKPTRLECMMQDYPKLLSPEAPVGITQGEAFYCYEPVKNNIRDAIGKQRKTGSACCGASGEFACYLSNRRFLQHAGVQFEPDEKREYAGIVVPYNARVVLQPQFGNSLKDIKNRIHGKVTVTAESTLVLDGDIHIYNLELDGALVIHGCPGAKVTVKNLTVKNDGVRFQEIDPDDEKVEEKYRIRGFIPDKRDVMELNFIVPGQYVVDDKTSLRAILV